MGERSKSKAVRVKVLDREESRDVYKILDRVVRNHRSDLEGAKIALAFREGWIPDADGNLIHSATRLRGDAERQLADADILVELNAEVWNASTPELREAVVLHALCRVMPKHDADGEPKFTETGLPVFRRRKPDVQEFQEVVAAFGSYHQRLAEFVDAARLDKSQPLLAEQGAEAAAPKRGRKPKSLAKGADA